MILRFLLLFLFTGFATSFAALPPLAQSLRELQTLFADEQLASALTMADHIESVEKNEKGYLIRTQKHTLQVDVEYLPATRPGPAPFKLTFEKAVINNPSIEMPQEL